MIILLLIAANGIFAGAEIAVVSVRKSRLQQLSEDPRPAARAISTLRNEPERFLATVQVGITVVSSTAAAFGGASVAQPLGEALARVPVLAPYSRDLALGIVIAVISYLSIVLGELVPKSLALRAGERYALFISRPMRTLSRIAQPLVWFLTASSNALLKPFGDKTNFTEGRVSAEELQVMVGEASRAGALDTRTAEIASRALDFGDLVAKDVMVPRTRIHALPLDATPEHLRQLLLEERHSRMPVYSERLDNVVGYIALQDVLALAWDKELVVLHDLLQPAYFVPETMPAARLLQEMQQRQVRLALVVDEHGELAGLVTLRDLLEELVGEIVGEHEAAEELIRIEAGTTAVVKGDAPIREVNRALDLALEEGADFTTIAGLCTSIAGRIPARGARLEAGDGTVLEVLEASPRHVRLVRVVPPPRSEAHPPA